MNELERNISALVQSSLNTLGILIKFQELLRTMQAEEKLTPRMTVVAAIADHPWMPMLIRWVAKAQQDHLISHDQGLALLSGQQIELTHPWLTGVIEPAIQQDGMQPSAH